MSDNSNGPDVPIAKRSARDAVFGFGTAIAAALFAWLAIPAGVVSPSSVKSLPLSPVFLPYVLTGLIGLFGLICGLQALIGPGVPRDPGDEDLSVRRGWALRFLIVLAGFAAYYLLPEMLGMLLASIIVTGLLVWLGGERRPLMIVGVAILLPLLVYLFFTQLAQVPMPGGYFENWI